MPTRFISTPPRRKCGLVAATRSLAFDSPVIPGHAQGFSTAAWT
jgi:hypothetical protein